MSEDNKVNRRRFLAAAGAGAIGGIARPASAQGTLAIRRQAEIPYKPDVLVVGGGPAGIGAALGAASAGANTLLIEHHAFFGGVAAWCLGMPINQMRPGGKPRSKLHELLRLQLLLPAPGQPVRPDRPPLVAGIPAEGAPRTGTLFFAPRAPQLPHLRHRQDAPGREGTVGKLERPGSV